MIPHSDADAPSVERAVLKRLKRLDPSLRLTWHRFQRDPLTGYPVRYRHGGALIEAPSFYLWRKSDTCGNYFFVKSYRHFGYRDVLALERDVARTMDHDKIASTHTTMFQEKQARDQAAHRDARQQVVKANRSIINDILLEGKRADREGKIFSAPGVSRRGSTGRVEQSRKEFGWEAEGD